MPNHTQPRYRFEARRLQWDHLTRMYPRAWIAQDWAEWHGTGEPPEPVDGSGALPQFGPVRAHIDTGEGVIEKREWPTVEAAIAWARSQVDVVLVRVGFSDYYSAGRTSAERRVGPRVMRLCAAKLSAAGAEDCCVEACLQHSVDATSHGRAAGCQCWRRGRAATWECGAANSFTPAVRRRTRRTSMPSCNRRRCLGAYTGTRPFP